MSNLIVLIACHFLADFPFQGDWLGVNKGKSWELMVYHCAIYTATFVLFAKVSITFAALLFVSHLIIDPLKARWKIIKWIWLDQLLHGVVIVFGALLSI